jgi:exodeoxyribonuclease V gamma subunit
MIDLDPSGGAVEPAGFEDPGSSTVLHHLQSALLHGARPQVDFDADDRSLRLHSCHSPMREMEVLRDEVLAALADGTAASVSDVLLLVPDIRVYAPFARSVFGAEIDNDGRRIRLPIRVADRSGATDQPYARLVLSWLELAAARLTLSEVFAVLQEEVVCAKFDFAADDLDTLRDRLVEAGVIWGVDPDRRAAHTGTPRFEGVSWREGLDRLLLGCFTGALDEFVGGVLPAADAAVGDTELLGDLAAALDALFSLLEQLDEERPIGTWVELLVDGLDRLTDTPDERTSIERARCVEVLNRIAADADGSEAPVGRLALIDLLGRDFEAMEAGGGLIGGAITVAELRPMRSLPARVVAVAGMDAESFPRRDPTDGLDLAGEHKRRKGDRSPRDDDRQLFLELLLCARERLIVSWVGRDQRDDHERTLSPCTQEVVDTLEELGFTGHTVEHALQPFASVNCEESTYDEAAVRAAAAMADVQPVARFVDTTLEPPEPTRIETISLGDLRAFWRSPSAWFCRRSVGIAMAWEREEEEAEALGLDGLQAWRLRDAALAQPELLGDEPRLRARFGLPANPLVAQDLRGLREEFAAFEAGAFSPAQVAPETVEVEGPDFVVRGRLPRHADGRLVELVAGSVKPKRTVQALVAHAVAGCAEWPGPSVVGSVRTPGKLEEWAHFARPHDVLAALVAGYRSGLESPLPFFPQTTFAFARALRTDLESREAFATNEVQKAWAYIPDASDTFADEGDNLDEAVALCTRGLADEELCSDAFIEWARNISAWCEEIGAKL